MSLVSRCAKVPAGGKESRLRAEDKQRMGNQMKIVMAIIKPFKLDEVREAHHDDFLV